jgi:hypothetical protein
MQKFAISSGRRHQRADLGKIAAIPEQALENPVIVGAMHARVKDNLHALSASLLPCGWPVGWPVGLPHPFAAV